MDRSLFLCCLLFTYKGFLFTANCQQGNTWYFGHHAGLSFNTSPPSPLTDGQLFTFEGCSAISDEFGQLLFYTDGITVWNNRHEIMSNGSGLRGHPSSSQSAIVIPKPGSASIYYIFTSDATENNNQGYYYSEIDMSLQGGLGGVTSKKNILIASPSTEKLTAVRHRNGIDIWVITKDLRTTAWNVFKVDCNGVDTTPVVSFAGHQPTGLMLDRNIGCLKSSPDATKIVAANTVGDFWELMKFDASTGIISEGLSFPIPEGQPFGAEFSPDSKQVYIGCEFLFFEPSHGSIFQYDLNTYDSAVIAASKKDIANTSHLIGGLQLGPDNKIYSALEFSTALSVINTPSERGAACEYSDEQVNLAGDSVFRGLPAFFQGLITNKNVDFNYRLKDSCGNVEFSATSTISGNLSWQWNFGDGTNGTGQTTSHTYANRDGKKYNVRLTVFSTSCGTATLVKEMVLPGSTPPEANFAFSIGCGNTSVSFIDSSADGSRQNKSWLWDFGDGSTSTAQNPTHQFATFGTYTVQLTVRTEGQCNLSSAQKRIRLGKAPVTDFSYTTSCVSNPVFFIDNSLADGETITDWSWDFGDKTRSHLQNPEKIYALGGVYDVKLVVHFTGGCPSDSFVKTVTVPGVPKAGFQISNVCEGAVISPIDTASGTGGIITRWFWNFGNGTNSELPNPRISYTSEGTYAVKQVVETSAGCISDTAFAIITVASAPRTVIVSAGGCQDDPISFKDSITTGSISKWHWNFGDGSVSLLENPTHTFTTAGVFLVKLNIESINGCLSDTVSKEIVIESAPKLTFTNTIACMGVPVEFTNIVSATSGTIKKYSWDFGDGSTSSLPNPRHTFPPGDFVTTLLVDIDNGCHTKISKAIHIGVAHAFAGNDTTVRVGQPFQLHASGGVLYQWTPPDFLDATNINNPTTFLQEDQHYEVKVTTLEGCVDYDTIFIRVKKTPSVNVPNAFVPEGKNRIFRPVLVGIRDLKYFSVYNRWGQLVFTTSTAGTGWDGRVKGMLQPTGTFAWVLKAIDEEGHIVIEQGTVTLIR